MFPQFIAALLIADLLALSTQTQAAPPDHRLRGLDSDPEVIYLKDVLEKPVLLKVIKKAPIFADRQGSRRLGFLKADQTVILEGMTDKVYRVRGEGTRNGVAGWVGPWAFSHPDEEFVSKLEQLYSRQRAVNAIIDAGGIAIGMTVKEVEQSKGLPSKSSKRLTADTITSVWEYIEYEEVKNYVTRIDPRTGQTFRQVASITKEEKSKTRVEFENETVTALQSSETNDRGGVHILAPPLVLGW